MGVLPRREVPATGALPPLSLATYVHAMDCQASGRLPGHAITRAIPSATASCLPLERGRGAHVSLDRTCNRNVPLALVASCSVHKHYGSRLG